MIKKTLDRFKSAMGSNAALPWIYGVYAVVFLWYAIIRVWNFIDYTANDDPIWVDQANSSIRYIVFAISITSLALFTFATFLVRMKSEHRDAFSRAHRQYMLQTVRLIVAFWVLEIVLYGTPLWLITWLFPPSVRLACAGFYLLAFARSIWGLRQYLRFNHPSPRDLQMYKTRGVKWFLICFPGVLMLGWLVTSGSWYVQDYFSKPGNTHTITIVTHGAASELPRKLRLVYLMKNPGPGCLRYSPFTGHWTAPRRASMLLRAPDVVTEHEQVFHFSMNEMSPGYCDWRLDHVQVIDGNRFAQRVDDPRFRDVNYSGIKLLGWELSSINFKPEGAVGTADNRPKVWVHEYPVMANLAKTTEESSTSFRHEFFLPGKNRFCIGLGLDPWICE